ncbi:MAG: hypothetical protein OEM63_13740, partial [Gammaproteobacteria bacterium]|nr:hypothetical protein [Gammaproteobacteria bacterium]
QYHRGREHGDVFDIIRDELLGCGAAEEQIRHFEKESDSFSAAIEWAKPGDLVVILDLGRNSDIRAMLDAQ